jgi:hypothetical protein
MFEPFFSLLGNGPSLLLVGSMMSLCGLLTGAVFFGPNIGQLRLLRLQNA